MGFINQFITFGGHHLVDTQHKINRPMPHNWQRPLGNDQQAASASLPLVKSRPSNDAVKQATMLCERKTGNKMNVYSRT